MSQIDEIHKCILDLYNKDIESIQRDSNLYNQLASVQAQTSLLLSFILYEPEGRPRFALFVKELASNTTEEQKAMSDVAKILLTLPFVSQYLPSDQKVKFSDVSSQTQAKPSPSDDAIRSNVIQFPFPPKPPPA